MRVVLFPEAHDSVIEWMLRCPRDLHHDRLLHFRRGHYTHQLLAGSAFLSAPLDACCFVRHQAFLNSFSRSRVFTRAKSRFTSRSLLRPSAWPVESWKRRRKICSAKSRSWISSSFLFISRYFSTRLAIRVPLLG